MRLILATLLLAVITVTAMYVGCRRYDMRPTSRLPINDRPLTGQEYGWAREMVWNSDSVATVERGRVWRDCSDNVHRDPNAPVVREYVASWGRIRVENYDIITSADIDVTIDGVLEVREHGRWWRLIRETINMLAVSGVRHQDSVKTRRLADYGAAAAQAKRDKFVEDSIRLFKLDSAMKAIGR